MWKDADENPNNGKEKPEKKAPRKKKSSDDEEEPPKQTVIEGFLDLLSPATPEALEEFNALEKKEKRRGVIPIDIGYLEMELNQLLQMTDVNTLDAQLKEIDSYLESIQGLCDDYIGDAASKSKKVQRWVKATLMPVTSRIKTARKRLSGMFSHCMNCWERAKRYYP